MAILCELNTAAWEEWLAERPEAVAKAARQYPPNRLYRMESTGHRVTILSYEEGDDGECKTCRVLVSADHNCVIFARQVFGVRLDGLTECDLPEEGELLGSLSSEPIPPEEMEILEQLIPPEWKMKQ